MPENEKRIVFRLDPKIWEIYDDERHRRRLDWQEIGRQLWDAWFRGDFKIKPIDSSQKPTVREYYSTRISNAIEHAKSASDQITKILAELEATGKEMESGDNGGGGNERDGQEQTNEALRDLNDKTKNLNRASDRNEGEIKRNAGKPRKGKRPDDKKFSDGSD